MQINFSSMKEKVKSLKDFKKICFLTVSFVLGSYQTSFSHNTVDDGKNKDAQRKTQESYHSTNQKKWYPTINFGGKYGNHRRLGQFSVFSPLWQNEDELLYLDLRFMGDSRRSKEGNFGIGKRWLLPNKQFILGVYGFYDRRHTGFHNIVNQATLGLEAMSETWDYRVNVYYPQNTSKEKEKSKEERSRVLNYGGAGHTAYVYKATSNRTVKVREVPLKGLDLEIGRAIPNLKALRLYGAYYHFYGRSGAKSIHGIRLRSKYQFNDNFSFLLEGSRDNVRKKNVFVGFELRIPLGETSDRAKNLTTLEKRMIDLPERDIDIVTNVTAPIVEESQPTTKVTEIHNVQFAARDGIGVNPDAPGDGTYENPFKINDINDSNIIIQRTQQGNPHEKWFIISNGQIKGEIPVNNLAVQIAQYPGQQHPPLPQDFHNLNLVGPLQNADLGGGEQVGQQQAGPVVPKGTEATQAAKGQKKMTRGQRRKENQRKQEEKAARQGTEVKLTVPGGADTVAVPQAEPVVPQNLNINNVDLVGSLQNADLGGGEQQQAEPVVQEPTETTPTVRGGADIVDAPQAEPVVPQNLNINNVDLVGSLQNADIGGGEQQQAEPEPPQDTEAAQAAKDQKKMTKGQRRKESQKKQEEEAARGDETAQQTTKVEVERQAAADAEVRQVDAATPASQGTEIKTETTKPAATERAVIQGEEQARPVVGSEARPVVQQGSKDKKGENILKKQGKREKKKMKRAAKAAEKAAKGQPSDQGTE